MPQTINTNLASLTAQRNLNTSQSANQRALQRLSSGLRINSARDDAAGLAISTRFTAQVRGLNVAIRNAGDGVSLAQTAEGALGSIADSLQRIRELSLQAANATNSDSDRQALNAEAQQLIEEISRVSTTTNFNGRKLLDGSFSASVQIGTTAGQTVSFGLAQVTSDTLGSGSGSGVSAIGTDNALANGDLIVNGVAISPSKASDDTASTANQAASAIAKVAAINRHSGETGVVASVNTNVAAGSSQTAADLSGSVTINGVAISVATGGVSTTADRQAVVTAINAKSDQTGVRAVDTGLDSNGVQLLADDGRNITISFTTVTAAATGLAAAGTYEGGFTLTSTSGEEIVIIEGGDGVGNGNLANAGLAAGTYKSTVAAVSTVARTTSTTLSTGDLVINGVNISAARAADDTASDTTATASVAAGSGIATAAAINRHTGETGVTARANATVVAGGTSTTAASAGDTGIVYVNGVATGTITATGTLASDRATAIDAINALTGRTGVVATDNGASISLTAADGRNISVAVDTADTNFATGIGLAGSVAGIGVGDITGGSATYAATAETTYSTVTLTAAGGFTISAGSNGGTGVSDIGFREGTFGGATDGQFLTDVDISTVEGATRALKAVDNSLETVSAERAKLGALQNRLDQTISQLAISAENASASNSRIQDADFARETAELSRTQVLQQAGVAILAQANAAPQLVLSLLQ
jgi:flagellin